MYHEKIIGFHNTFSNHIQSMGYNEGFPEVENLESFLYKKLENEKKEIEQENQYLKDEIKKLKKLYHENLCNTKADFQHEIELIEKKFKTSANKIYELEAKLNYFYNGDIFKTTVFGNDYPKLRKIYDFLIENKLLRINPTTFYFNIDKNSDGVIEFILLNSDFTQEDLGCFLFNLKANFRDPDKSIDVWLNSRVKVLSKHDNKNDYETFKDDIRPYSRSIYKPEFYGKIILFFKSLKKN